MKDLPIQKLSSKQKTKKWFKESALAAYNIAVSEGNDIAMSNEDKQTNLDLYDGIVNEKELKKQFDTMKLFEADYTPSFKNFAVVKDKIDLLHGEYIERNEEYGVAVTDANSLSIKMEERREAAAKLLQEVLTSNDMGEDEVRNKLRSLEPDRFTSTYEKAANKLLSIVKKTSKLPYLKSEGFREAMIVGQAIFYVGVRNDSVYVRKTDPSNIYTVRSGKSNDVNDSEIIAEVRYLPRGKIIDEYGEDIDSLSELKKIIESGGTDGVTGSSSLTRDQIALWHQSYDGEKTHEFFPQSRGDSNNLAVTDGKGNIRVVDVSWKGYKKILKRKYYEPNTGEVHYDYVNEEYSPDVDAGEEVTVRYVTEWYRSTIVGGDHILNHGVREPRVAGINNPFESSSGYVGGYFNIVNNKVKSIVSLIAPFTYLINILYARAEDIISKNMGKIIEMDLANIPEGWTVKKTLMYMKVHGIRVKDSFKQGNKGVAQGKLAGHMNQSSTPMDMEIGSSLSQILGMIETMEGQISKMTGLTPQRLGSISSRELVGNVERSQVQSSHITEYWFNRYEQIMLDLNYLVLNTARQLVKKGVVFQAVLDDYTYSVFENEDEGFNSAQIDLFPVNSKRYRRLSNTLEQTLIQGLPNGQVSYSEIIRIFKAQNSFDMIVEVQKMEDEKERKEKQRVQQEQEAAQKQQQQAIQAEAERIKGERDHEILIKQMEIEGKMELELLKSVEKGYHDGVQIDRDDNNNGVKDNIELEREKIKERLEEMKIAIDRDRLTLDAKKASDDKEIKLKDIEVKRTAANRPTSKS